MPSQLPGDQMRQVDRHHLLDCLKGNVTNRYGTFLDVVDRLAVVHFLVPGTCGTFEDYLKHVFW